MYPWQQAYHPTLRANLVDGLLEIITGGNRDRAVAGAIAAMLLGQGVERLATIFVDDDGEALILCRAAGRDSLRCLAPMDNAEWADVAPDAPRWRVVQALYRAIQGTGRELPVIPWSESEATELDMHAIAKVHIRRAGRVKGGIGLADAIPAAQLQMAVHAEIGGQRVGDADRQQVGVRVGAQVREMPSCASLAWSCSRS